MGRFKMRGGLHFLNVHLNLMCIQVLCLYIAEGAISPAVLPDLNSLAVGMVARFLSDS